MIIFRVECIQFCYWNISGCGNGRYLNINKSTYKVGVDVCSGLVDNARIKGTFIYLLL